MNAPIPIYLAVEDELSEWVVRRVLSVRPVAYAVGAVFGRSGFGYLKKQAPAFNNAARSCPFLLLTDLDRHACPPALIKEWLVHPKHPDFLLRVAVREVESWLLGDGEGICRYLGVGYRHDGDAPEGMDDPKQELLKLALRSPRRAMRDALVHKDDTNGRLSQGSDYNGALARFVIDLWDIEAASGRCPSLRRLFGALERIEEARRW